MGPEPEILRAWVIERVAYYTGRSANDIPADVALTDLGVDSVYALTICGDIEDHFGLSVNPELAWDYPTIDALVGRLCDPDRATT